MLTLPQTMLADWLSFTCIFLKVNQSIEKTGHLTVWGIGKCPLSPNTINKKHVIIGRG